MKLKEVLVIDDSDTDLLYTQIILNKAQIASNVLTFGTGLEALEFLQRREGHDANVILLDINMPEMNGLEFLERYQALHAGRQARTEVVMLTSSPDPADRLRALRFDCVKGYVVKPIDLPSANQLVAVLGQVGGTAS
jgi:CheY-like chemotaxis protein